MQQGKALIGFWLLY